MSGEWGRAGYLIQVCIRLQDSGADPRYGTAPRAAHLHVRCTWVVISRVVTEPSLGLRLPRYTGFGEGERSVLGRAVSGENRAVPSPCPVRCEELAGGGVSNSLVSPNNGAFGLDGVLGADASGTSTVVRTEGDAAVGAVPGDAAAGGVAAGGAMDGPALENAATDATTGRAASFGGATGAAVGDTGVTTEAAAAAGG